MAAVPVGLTKYREGLTPLRLFTQMCIRDSAGTVTVDGGYRDGIPQSQVVKLVEFRRRASGRVALVDAEHHRLAAFLEHHGHILIVGRHPGAQIGHQHDNVRLVDGQLGLPPHLGEDHVVGMGLDAPDVYKRQENKDPNRKDIDAKLYGDEDFTNALKTVKIDEAKIIEYKKGGSTNTAALVLRLDKSNTSRQVAKLEAAGLVARETDSGDARASRLSLTPAGLDLRNRIDQFATEQVSRALRPLAPPDQEILVRYLSLYADALARENPNTRAAQASDAIELQIQEGYAPGLSLIHI